jgi:hypothetical protein
MDWQLKNKSTGGTLTKSHTSKDMALAHLVLMGEAFFDIYEAVPVTNDPTEYRILTEGLVAGDLRRIILPQISVDEYLPGDNNSDNVVIAFFIKNVSAAVVPFRDFVMKCGGVLDTAYSDSDTQPDTSIVYVELARQIKMSDISEMMDQVSLLTNLKVDDFTILFPSSTKRHPYSLDTLERYFNQRSNKQNWKAQKKALDNMLTSDDASVNDTESDDDAVVEQLIERFGV